MKIDNRQAMISFADKFFGEYKIKNSGQDEKLIPRLCPLCHGGLSGRDKDTFCLFLNNGTFVCKRGSCGRHGRFEELAKELANEDIKLVRSTHANKSEKQYVLPSTPVELPTEEIYRYFESRCISRSTVDAMKIGADQSGNIVFRFYLDGEEIFRKYRAPRKPGPNDRKEWQDSGTKPILYNMDNVFFSRPLVITEGMMDMLSLYEAGITNAVSVPSGCDNLSWVTSCWDWLEKFNTIILFGDNDAPGKKMVDELIKKLGEYRVLVVRDYPQIPGSDPAKYCKDANEILYRLGESALIEMIDNAEEIKTRGLMKLADVVPYDPTKVPRIKTMIPLLDETIGGLAEGGVSVLTGASGKQVTLGEIARIEYSQTEREFFGSLDSKQQMNEALITAKRDEIAAEEAHLSKAHGLEKQVCKDKITLLKGELKDLQGQTDYLRAYTTELKAKYGSDVMKAETMTKAQDSFNIAKAKVERNEQYASSQQMMNRWMGIQQLTMTLSQMTNAGGNMISEMVRAKSTMEGVEQTQHNEQLDQIKDLFQQAETVVQAIVQLMQAVLSAENESLMEAIRA